MKWTNSLDKWAQERLFSDSAPGLGDRLMFIAVTRSATSSQMKGSAHATCDGNWLIYLPFGHGFCL